MYTRICFRQLESRFSDETVDCMSWEPVVVLEHNKQALVEDQIAPTGLQGEDSDDRKKSFAKVYANNEWGNGPKSGPGSLLENSWIAIKTLNIVVEKIMIVLGKEKIRLTAIFFSSKINFQCSIDFLIHPVVT